MTIKEIMKSDPETVNSVLQLMELASTRTRIEDNKLKPDMSFKEAAEKWGAAIVKGWADKGLIKIIQDGPKCRKRIDRARIEAVAKSNNRGL
jgi:hypothetical protein